MKVIPREARRITYSSEIRSLKLLPFDKRQMAVIIGTILGDGCLMRNWSKTNYRLQIRQSADQKDYLMWKYGILKQWILSEPKLYIRTNSYTARTISHPQLTDIWKKFYPEGKKIIPKDISDLIRDPLTLAVWFMDDGNIRKNKEGLLMSYDINTQSFTKKENERLKNVLCNLFGLHTTINLNNGYYRLHVSAYDKFVFRDLVKEFIVPSMRYKLG